MRPPASEPRLRGITFAKQFPNPAEPLRGLFVAEQVAATSPWVDWSVVAPVPWAPRPLAAVLGKPFVKGDEAVDGVTVLHPRYPVLPRRLLYGTVGRAMAASARAGFRRLARERRSQFVHAHALYPSAAAARRLAAEAGLPYLVSIHGSDLYANLSHASARRQILAAAHDASHVVCVSESLARDAREQLGLDEAHVSVVPDTFDEARFTLQRREPHEGPTRLVTVGRLVPVKGHDVLIDAMATLLRAGADVELTIVGAGPLRGDLEARAARAGIADRVTLSGALAPEGLLDALARADLYVLPSRREGFGVALIEALATGLPAVATRSGGPDGIVREAEGALVEPEDAAALAAALAATIARLGSLDPASISAAAHERFGRDAVAAALVALYREVAGAGGTTRRDL